ncbi:MAG: glycosyltransferase [Proteobacteria bacterium]|nr:glycosyltransferase [Pseudomonadota bacterium]MBU4470429.1 glycosyltransferase [Pseudomonadota bacterium]MCG2753482.1 glycosyltransferase [Desulfobacteraceae bacterium]
MEQQKFISICIPVYNGSIFLSQTIQSVLSQTYSNYELLIIDDGSNDDSDKIVTEFACNDPRIIYLKNPRRLGLVGNWNECIKRSRGNWVKFIFQDDILEAYCIERMVKTIKDVSNEIKVIFCARDFLFENVDSDEVDRYKQIKNIWDIYPNKIYFNLKDIVEIIRRFPAINIFGEPSSFLIHKDIFDQIGLFDSSFHHICDLEYWLRAGINQSLLMIPDVMVHFRVHTQSTSNFNRQQKWMQLRYLERLRLFLKFMHDDSYKALRDELNTWPCRMFLKTKTAIMARRARIDLKEAKNAEWDREFGEFCEEHKNIWALSHENYILLGIKYLISKFHFELKRLVK